MTGLLLVCVSAVGGAPRASAATLYNWYLAEGYTNTGYQEYICLGNPGTSTAGVTVTFLYNGASPKQATYSVPPRSRSTIDVNSAAGFGKEVSARVTSSRSDLAVERSQYFIYSGTYYGSHVVQAAREASRTWYFAEGYTGPGFDEYVCVLNTNSSNANLTFRFQTPSGEQVKTGSVPAGSRATFKVNDLMGPGVESSLKLESDRSVVAERPTYFDYLGVGNNHWKGGHCVMGSTSPGTSFYFAEGTTRAGFEEWVTIQNANSYAITVNAAFQFDPSQGAATAKSYRVNARSRFTFYVPAEAGAEKDVSVCLTSNRNFLAERPQYYQFGHSGFAFEGGICSIGAKAPGNTHFLAEGYTGPYFEEWLCIQNPSSRTSRVTVQYYTQERGALAPISLSIRANTRVTYLVNEQAGPNLSLAVKVTVTSGSPVVVERPIYVDAAGNPARNVVPPAPPVPPGPEPPVDPPVDPPPATGKAMHGMCFSPFLTDWSVTSAEVSALMDKIAPYSKWIRTFGSEGEWDWMPDMAHSKGMSIAGGADVWDDAARNQREVSQLIAQCQRGDIDHALVGDEALENNALSEDQMISYLRQVRATGVPTSTSQTYYHWLQTPRVVAECDFLTMNAYPYWDQVSIDQAVARLDTVYRQVKNVAGGKKVVVETGWPTAGPTNGQAVANAANGARYLREFIDWANRNGVEYYYFEAFDESWKEEGGCGAHWGLWGTDANLKPEYSAVLNP